MLGFKLSRLWSSIFATHKKSNKFANNIIKNLSHAKTRAPTPKMYENKKVPCKTSGESSPIVSEIMVIQNPPIGINNVTNKLRTTAFSLSHFPMRRTLAKRSTSMELALNAIENLVKSLKYKIKFPNTRLTRIRAIIDFFIF